MLKNIPIPQKCNIVVVFRRDELIIPRGADRLMANDRVVVALGDSRAMPRIKALFGGSDATPSVDLIEKVMIFGATRIGLHLARMLEKDVSIVLMEEDEDACIHASERLQSSLVIQGCGTDASVLLDEGIGHTDAFVATSEKEESNILSCILAKQYGAKKTIALIDRPGLKLMLEQIGIDITVSPRLATVTAILQHAHRAEIPSLSVLHDGEARIVELKVKPGSKVAGKLIRKIPFPRNTLVGAIVHEGLVVIPGGDDRVEVGDSLIIFAKTNTIPALIKLF